MPVVAPLHQEPARHLPPGQPRRPRIRQAAGHQQPQVLLRREDPRRALRDLGRDHHLGENLRDRRRRRLVQHPVERDDAAESRHPVAVEGRLVGLQQARPPRHAAGVGVLDDRAGRAVVRHELRHQLEGRIRVVDVVVGERLALQLPRRRHPRSPAAVAIEGRALVRVLAIAQPLRQHPRKAPPPRRLLPDRPGHPTRHRRVVGGSAPERGQRLRPAKAERRGPPVRRQLRHAAAHNPPRRSPRRRTRGSSPPTAASPARRCRYSRCRRQNRRQPPPSPRTGRGSPPGDRSSRCRSRPAPPHGPDRRAPRAARHAPSDAAS